jgi:hypothetical protein
MYLTSYLIEVASQARMKLLEQAIHLVNARFLEYMKQTKDITTAPISKPMIPSILTHLIYLGKTISLTADQKLHLMMKAPLEHWAIGVDTYCSLAHSSKA